MGDGLRACWPIRPGKQNLDYSSASTFGAEREDVVRERGMAVRIIMAGMTMEGRFKWPHYLILL
jgi:hypothetical protein